MHRLDVRPRSVPPAEGPLGRTKGSRAPTPSPHLACSPPQSASYKLPPTESRSSKLGGSARQPAMEVEAQEAAPGSPRSQDGGPMSAGKLQVASASGRGPKKNRRRNLAGQGSSEGPSPQRAGAEASAECRHAAHARCMRLNGRMEVPSVRPGGEGRTSMRAAA